MKNLFVMSGVFFLNSSKIEVILTDKCQRGIYRVMTTAQTLRKIAVL